MSVAAALMAALLISSCGGAGGASSAAQSAKACNNVPSQQTESTDYDCQPNMTIRSNARHSTYMYGVTPSNLTELGGHSDVKGTLGRLPQAPVVYADGEYYMAFILAYLEDIGALAPVEEDITQHIQANVDHALFNLYDPSRMDLSKLDVSKFDADTLAREYFAGPIHRHSAGAKLLEAVRVLQENLSGMEKGNLLLVQV